MPENITSFEDINQLLAYFSDNLLRILGNHLVGFYLHGSLTYGDFDTESSDVDLVVVLDYEFNKENIEKIKRLHQSIAILYPTWGTRIECSYVPLEMLNDLEPPKKTRPYYNEGVFYESAPYGNEWIINNYLLYQHGINLIGKDFRELINPIDIKEVQKACIQDLFQEWRTKIRNDKWMESSYHQAYLVINVCRIFYTITKGETATKRIAADWTKNRLGSEWSNLIVAALNFKHGQKLDIKKQAIEFAKFVIEQVKP